MVGVRPEAWTLGSSGTRQSGRLKEFGCGESERVRRPRKFGLNTGSLEEAWNLTSSACWKKLGRWEFGRLAVRPAEGVRLDQCAKALLRLLVALC